MDTTLMLLNRVFLVAAVVGIGDDFRGRGFPVVGDIEEASLGVKELTFTA